MENKMTDEKAFEAVKDLVRYCYETGCLYCHFVDMTGNEINCDIGRPREWRIKDE